MLDRFPPHLRNPRAGLVVVLLLLTLGLAAVLAYQAQDAARSHRATAESALRDYAGFAAWEFSRGAERSLHCVLSMSLRPLIRDPEWYRSGDPMPHPSVLSEMECDCPMVTPHYYFRLDLQDGSVRTSGDSPPATVLERLADSVAAHADRIYEGEWNHATLIQEGERRDRLVAYHLRRDEEGAPHAAYGLVTDPADLRPALAKVADRPLLPPSLVRGVETDSLLAIEVDAGERPIYRSPVGYASAFRAVDTLSSRFGGLNASLTLRPEAAEELVIGGLPGSRLPMVLGLMALAVALVLVALHQFRRQQELARLRADFVSGTSHELRTPLSQIRMFAETLLLGRVRSEKERRHSLKIIVQEARRLAHLVGNVLQFSRAERQETRIDPEPTDVESLVTAVVDSFAPLARTHEVRLHTEVQEGIMASVDPDAVRQILLNLLDNAVKYGPAGQEISVSAFLADGQLQLLVDDEGPGIPAGERERIWDSFSRLERDAESTVGGTGIGLAVVRELVALHDGCVRVEAAAGGGARFVVEFPIAWVSSGSPDLGIKQEAGPPSGRKKGEAPVPSVHLPERATI